MSRMKVLISGAQGQLGQCLLDRVDTSLMEVIAVDREHLDITSRSHVLDFCEQNKPDLIINAAAYTAVDKAEDETELAYRVNTEGPRHLAEASSVLNIPLIHVSTDYVFDGRAIQAYKPGANTSPQSIYGDSKLAGEQVVSELNPKHVIIRTAWVFSEYGHNFVKTMLRLGSERDSLSVVADQYGCPTYAGDLADAILNIALYLKGQTTNTSLFGIHHFCGDEATSWHGFARVIFQEAFEQGFLATKPALNAISTSAYPTPAQRPEYSVLDCCSFPVSNVNRDWKVSLRSVISELQKR
ncbi:dTDP-4-dehydrorhamnose reductase [Spongorhabdus nitratireducens]